MSAKPILKATAFRAGGRRDRDLKGICLVECIFGEPSRVVHTALKRRDNQIAIDTWENTLVQTEMIGKEQNTVPEAKV